MDIKALSESIYSFVNYDGCATLTKNEINLTYEFKKQLLGSEVESHDMFVEMYLRHYIH